MPPELIEVPEDEYTSEVPTGGRSGVTTQINTAPEPEEIEEEVTMQYTKAMDALNAYHALVNIAPELPEEKIKEIGERVMKDYEFDLNSTAAWRDKIKEIIDYAKMVVEIKTWGGDVIANVRFPLIAQGAINFNSRAYPEIVKNKEVVKFAVIGNDDGGKKAARASRLSQHMNYQITQQMPDWEELEDNLLLVLPVIGSAFKKTYYDVVKRTNVSDLVFPDELIVNYFAKNIETASRITHRIELRKNEVIERVKGSIFSNIDIKNLKQETTDSGDEKFAKAEDSESPENDEDAPFIFLEQHRFLDLDGDDYEEPYIVTVRKDTGDVVRICARYDLDGIETNDNGEIMRIQPVHYFTRFLFLPSVDGSFYGEGLGTLMISMNNAIDDGVNQLLDAGSQQNRPSGFLAAGVVVGPNRGGSSFQLKKGEWRTVENSGDDLRKGIVEAPLGRPSPVTLKMLELLIDSGKEISMSAAVLTEGGGANTPAATTLALIEQNLKPVSAVFKRIYRAHRQEFAKLVRLNRLYLTQDEYMLVLDDMEANVDTDYNSRDCNVLPVLDPNNASDSLRLMKGQALMQMKGQGLNDDEINKRYLMALNIENVDKLLPDPSQPDPLKAAQAEALQLENALKQAEINLTNEKAATERVEQFVKLKGVDFDKATLILKAAQTNADVKSKEMKALNEGGKMLGGDVVSPMPAPAQGGPYQESGLRSNNVKTPGEIPPAQPAP